MQVNDTWLSWITGSVTTTIATPTTFAAPPQWYINDFNRRIDTFRKVQRDQNGWWDNSSEYGKVIRKRKRNAAAVVLTRNAKSFLLRKRLQRRIEYRVFSKILVGLPDGPLQEIKKQLLF